MADNSVHDEQFFSQMQKHLEVLYSAEDAAEVLNRLAERVSEFKQPASSPSFPPASAEGRHSWSERDSLLITYGDSLLRENETPIQTLRKFMTTQCRNAISSVHVLPFYPFSSDDGFAVIDYLKVRDDLGTWDDIETLAAERNLMVDLVINHISSESGWFKSYCENQPGFEDFFIEAQQGDDLSQVVRPRASPLLRATQTSDGVKQLWCTFSHDQIDLNFANPNVMAKFIDIFCTYLEHGAKLIRLDAIGYLWKEPGTSCIHLPKTHEVVRMMNTLCTHLVPGSMIITETNVPNHENLSYFGNRNEAHAIYNFSLAPLMVHALLTGSANHLKQWMMSMPPAPDGCTYLNFTASHDGIGMRPAEGLLTDHEQSQLIETIRRHEGLFSTRRAVDGNERVYELNISLFDAFKGTVEGEDDYQIERFLCSQTIMLGVEGIPAFYIHSLLATPNDHELVKQTGRARSINRHVWSMEELLQLLDDPTSDQHKVLNELLRRIQIRCGQAAFHPNATQFTLQSNDKIFGFWRQSRNREQSIFAIHNISNETQQVSAGDLNLIVDQQWWDLLTDQEIVDHSEALELQPYQCMWITNRRS